jgi:hemolysin activation/secretion protein
MSGFAITNGCRPKSAVRFLWVILLFGVLPAAHGQAMQGHALRPDGATPGIEIQRRQEQQTDIQRSRSIERPNVFTPTETTSSPPGGDLFPEETPCFRIQRIDWQDVTPPDWLAERAQAAVGRCIGGHGLQALQNDLIAQLINRGYATSRVLVPEQALASGTLAMRYFRGVISQVQSNGMPGWWRMALPSGPGNEVDQRDLDQAMENIRRLVGQSDASIDLVPGAQPGESDVVMHPGTGNRLHGYVGGDNGGVDDTGKYQINAGLTLDSPFFLYDQLTASWNSNANMGNDEAGTRSSFSVQFTF